ncbi:MAG: allantoinase PuuE [Ectothiorhodospiraceae bacterium]|nr:allantoinase PuuE [Chromatiales bacterium]MCP5156268.1 allantoinase PuuE [Ectothiorhodospiraceae bacterium]
MTQPRDFVGYGRNPPDPRWPGGARLALNFVINVEEGSEASIADGDGFTEARLTEVPASPVPHGERDLGAESMFEYGSRVGFWRLHRLFRERDMPVTPFVCARALERNPAIAAAIRDAGWDICGHGLRWVEHYRLDEDEERRQIHEAVASIERSVGRRPLGWYCRYAPSVNTRRLLAEEGGFLYDSDAYNDELPYWVQVDGGPHLVVPYTLTHNDTQIARGPIGTGREFFRYLREAFDMLLAEGRRAPRMMSVGLHQRIVGHPGRASGLARFLDHVAGQDGVWVAARADIARHWHETFPPPTAA